MKPFQLYPKPLAHLTCKSSPPPETGERNAPAGDGQIAAQALFVTRLRAFCAQGRFAVLPPHALFSVICSYSIRQVFSPRLLLIVRCLI